MQPLEELVWFADDDDRYYTLKHSGGVLVALLAVPILIAICTAAGHSGAGALIALVVVALPLVVAAGYAGWEFLADRRNVVRIQLTPANHPNQLTVVRVDGGTATYPLSALRRMEITRTVVVGTARSSTIRLVFDQRLETPRRGLADLPQRWAAALEAAEVDVQVHDYHPMQQGQQRPPRYRRTKAWRDRR